VESVRAAVEPMNTALGSGPTIFLSGSFSGLPLVNQALAAENPTGDGSFIVTVRGLMRVLARITPAAVLEALAVQHAPPRPVPAPPPPHQVPPPGSQPMVTCSAEMDLANPGFGGITNIRVFGGGFVASEVVNVIEFEQIQTTTVADTLGSYSVTMGVFRGQFPTSHTVRTHGSASGRTSNNAGYTV